MYCRIAEFMHVHIGYFYQQIFCLPSAMLHNLATFCVRALESLAFDARAHAQCIARAAPLAALTYRP